MSQNVSIVGSELIGLVPFSRVFLDASYAVTLAQAEDVIARAMSFASTRQGWLIVLLDGQETPEACIALNRIAPVALFVTPVEHEALHRTLYALDLPVIHKAEGPLVALASLVATSRWIESAPSQTSIAEPGRLAPGSAC
jgi:hypothetical protein